jgi:hypothetical protein
VGGEYGTHGTEECTRYRWKSLNKRDHTEDRVVYGRMGSKWNFGTLAGGVELMQPARDTDR